MNDKLKEIKESKFSMHSLLGFIRTSVTISDIVDSIQSESYQLGRSEVIEEIENWLNHVYNRKNEHHSITIDRLMFLLTQLKETK